MPHNERILPPITLQKRDKKGAFTRVNAPYYSINRGLSYCFSGGVFVVSNGRENI